MPNYSGNVTVIGRMSHSQMTKLSELFGHSFSVPSSLTYQNKEGKLHATYGFTGLERLPDSWDVAALVWDYLGEYAWVGVFLGDGVEKVERRMTYAEYKEYDE